MEKDILNYLPTVMFCGHPVVSLNFFKSLKSKSAQKLRPQNGNSKVSFNDTLLTKRIFSFVFKILSRAESLRSANHFLKESGH